VGAFNKDMGFLNLFSGGVGLAGSAMQSDALRRQGDYARQQGDANARLSDLQALESYRKGSKEAANIKQKAGQVLSSQRAALAAQGLDLGSGTAADVQQDTQELSTLDAEVARNNAWREAWGFKAKALDQRTQGEQTQMAKRNEASMKNIEGATTAFPRFMDAASHFKKQRDINKAEYERRRFMP
jgi:hypothetical protein